MADDDRYTPSYGKPDLSKALIAERGAEATAEKTVAELEAKVDASATRDVAAEDQLRAAQADLAVRRRFIGSLEACEATGMWCPPRLDDPPWGYDVEGDKAPPLNAPLHFELAPWRAIAAELHGRACACRTLTCVDSVTVAIDVLETKPVKDVLGDESATESITRARECLFRLRGKIAARPPITSS